MEDLQGKEKLTIGAFLQLPSRLAILLHRETSFTNRPHSWLDTHIEFNATVAPIIVAKETVTASSFTVYTSSSVMEKKLYVNFNFKKKRKKKKRKKHPRTKENAKLVIHDKMLEEGAFSFLQNGRKERITGLFGTRVYLWINSRYLESLLLQ